MPAARAVVTGNVPQPGAVGQRGCPPTPGSLAGRSEQGAALAATGSTALSWSGRGRLALGVSEWVGVPGEIRAKGKNTAGVGGVVLYRVGRKGL